MTIVPVAYDFTCEWCWIGVQQVLWMQATYDVAFEWRSYELYPEPMPFPEPLPMAQHLGDRPQKPTRLMLAFAAQGMRMPSPMPNLRIRTRLAHLAALHARKEHRQQEMVLRLFEGLWREHMDLSELSCVEACASDVLGDVTSLLESLDSGREADEIIPFDDLAYQSGVYNLPTFWIDGIRYAEQPQIELQRALDDAHVAHRNNNQANA